MRGTGRFTASIWDPPLIRRALVDALWKLNPLTMARNPVMFVVEVGAVLVSGRFALDVATNRGDLLFEGQIVALLWLTVLFANFAEAMAEGRGKAQADSLRRAKTDTLAHRVVYGNAVEQVPATQLLRGDVVLVSAGAVIPGDGEIIEGVASVDESAITGESAPVIREAGGDRSAVTGGTRVLSDWIKVRITANPGETFLDRMIALVEGAARQKTPNEIALNILLAGLTIIFLVAVVTLQPLAVYSGAPQTVFVLVSLLVCLIPTTIGGLLSAIGIAGMDRMVQHNVLATSGRAVEAAGDVHTLLLDKTGTITLGNRQAVEFIPLSGRTDRQVADAAQLASLADETPEGRSIVVLAKERYGLRERELGPQQAIFVPFTASTRMSGVNLDGREIRKGASDAIGRYISARGGVVPEELSATVQRVARSGVRCWWSLRMPVPWGHPSEGRGEGRHSRALRASPSHGHSYGDDYGRQPAHRRCDRRGSGRRRLPCRSNAGSEDGPDPAGTSRRQARRHDRRRHQRCAGARAGGCRRRDEHRDPGGEGSRQHGRPGLEPDQAD